MKQKSVSIITLMLFFLCSFSAFPSKETPHETKLMALKGIALGDSIKMIKGSSSAWKVLVDRDSVDPTAPVEIYSMMNVPEKRPLIVLLGDDNDIDFARVVLIKVAYPNYDKVGIRKEDFLAEMKDKWGEPSNTYTNPLKGNEIYEWANKKAGYIGRILFGKSELGPVVNIYLGYIEKPIKGTHSRAKAKAVLE